MFENPRRGRQARNFTTNVPKILVLKSSSEQIFFRKLPLGAPVNSLLGVSSVDETLRFMLDRYCIKIRYPIYREGSDFHCFYFSQTTTNTVPSLCFSWLLFNLFLTSKLNSKFTLQLFSDLISNDAFKGLISWIIMNQCSTNIFFQWVTEFDLYVA